MGLALGVSVAYRIAAVGYAIGKANEEAEQNKNQLEDSLVLKFKEDLTAEFIHANTITKIKPVISDNWIKLIST